MKVLQLSKFLNSTRSDLTFLSLIINILFTLFNVFYIFVCPQTAANRWLRR